MTARATRTATVRLLVSFVALCSLTGAVAPSTAVAAVTPSAYVVVLNDSVVDVDAAILQLQSASGLTAKLRFRSAIKGFSADLTPGQATTLRASPMVAFLEPDRTFQAVGMTQLAANDAVPAGIRRVGAATTLQVHTASDANIAILDSGIDLAHPDLSAVSGTNCIKPGTAAQDDNGHGTHVAGIAGAKNNGSNVVGVAPGTRLYSVKVLGPTASGTLSQILCGIDWVTANASALNIRVANMSIAGAGANDNNCGNSNSDSEHKAICRSVAAGISYVAAAGNSGANFANAVPAAYPEVLTATAMTDTDGVRGSLGPVPTCTKNQKDDSYATFSNYAVNTTEQSHAIAAPGTCVVSDNRGGGTTIYYGTSQAAPHVAGAVALCLGNGGVAGACSSLSPAQIIQKLRSDAAATATATNGFLGDPLRPITGKHFGYLLRADLY